jgi:hypothetical protein
MTRAALNQGQSALFCAAFVLCPALVELSRAESGFSPPDCGTNSLYVLLRITGNGKGLDEILSGLPDRPQNGYSMLELQGAARRCGLSLWGGYLTKNNLPLRRPVIAHLDSHKPQSGHYVVLVPVGTTGTMVQVIDHPYYPVITDYTQIIKGNERLRILYPVAQGENVYVAILLIFSLVLVIAIVMSSIRKRRQRGAPYLLDRTTPESPDGVLA